MRLLYRARLAVISVALLLTLTACGGGGGPVNQAPPPPPPAPIPAQLTVVSGDNQAVFPGGTLLSVVLVLRQGLNPVSGVTVSLSASGNLTFFPATVTTTTKGEASFIALMPNTPFARFTITATATGGGSVMVTASTGPRLMSVFGNAGGFNAVVNSSGEIWTRGDAGRPDEGGFVFRADGTVSRRLGYMTGAFDISRGLTHASDPNMIFLTPDQKLYLYSYAHVFVFDQNYNLARMTNIWGQNSGGPPMGQFFAAGLDGTTYLGDSQSIRTFSPTGVQTHIRFPQGSVAFFGAVPDSMGNVVVVEDEIFAGSSLRMYRPNSNTLVRSVTLPSRATALGQDHAGRFVVTAGSSNQPLLLVYDEQFNLITQLAPVDIFGQPMQAGPGAFDPQGNYYSRCSGGFCKWNSQGQIQWRTAAQPGQQSVGMTAPPHPNPFTIAVHNYGMAVDSSTNSVYVSNGTSIVRYVSGVYTSEWLVAPSHASHGEVQGMAVSASNELYATAFSFNIGLSHINVFDLTGNPLRSITYPQFGQLSGIVIDPVTREKFIVDLSNRSVHVLDSQDAYVRSFPVNVPAAMRPLAGNIVLVPDSTLLMFVTGTNGNDPPTYLKNIRRDGTEISSQPQNFPSVKNIALDSLGNLYMYFGHELEVRRPDGTTLGRLSMEANTSSGFDMLAMASSGDRVWFYFLGKIIEVSAQ